MLSWVRSPRTLSLRPSQKSHSVLLEICKPPIFEMNFVSFTIGCKPFNTGVKFCFPRLFFKRIICFKMNFQFLLCLLTFTYFYICRHCIYSWPRINNSVIQNTVYKMKVCLFKDRKMLIFIYNILTIYSYFY